MNKIALSLLSTILMISLVGITGCGGSKSTGQVQTSGVNPKTTTGPTSGASNESGLLRNENWLSGTWSATVPKTDTSKFAGRKIILNVASVMLISDEKVQGSPTGKYAYSGSLIWNAGGEEKSLGFIKEDWAKGEGTLIWEYASPAPNQFMENITMRIYDLTYSFELDWGPQIAKPGSAYKSLGFFGSIQNLGTSDKDEFDPGNLINFTQTSSTAPTLSSTKPTTAAAGSSSTKTSATPRTLTPDKITSTGLGTTDIWGDIPVYPNAQRAEDQGFGLSSEPDEEFSKTEWHFLATTDDFTKVVDFYKKQMPAKGWTRTSWADVGEMSYGSFQKNNETRMCMVYIIQSEGGAAINMMSAAK